MCISSTRTKFKNTGGNFQIHTYAHARTYAQTGALSVDASLPAQSSAGWMGTMAPKFGAEQEDHNFGVRVDE